MRHCFFLLIIFGLASCNSNRIFEDNVDFKDRSWKVNVPAQFEFEILDTTKKYNLYIDIRNSLDYPYSRLFVNSLLYDSTGGELSKKLVTEFLFDQKTGEPQGSSGIGDIYDHRFQLLNNYRFRKGGKHKMKFEQFMRQDTLQGILAVGLRVETVAN